MNHVRKHYSILNCSGIFSSFAFCIVQGALNILQQSEEICITCKALYHTLLIIHDHLSHMFHVVLTIDKHGQRRYYATIYHDNILIDVHVMLFSESEITDALTFKISMMPHTLFCMVQ